MRARKEFPQLRAGIMIGMAFGFCFAYLLLLVSHAFGWLDRASPMHPVIWLFPAVPLLWFYGGARLLRKVTAPA